MLFNELYIAIKYFVVIVTLGGLGAVLSRIRASGQVQDNEAMVLTAWLSLKIAKHHPSLLLYKEAREKLFIFSLTRQIFALPILFYPTETTTVEEICLLADLKAPCHNETFGSIFCRFPIFDVHKT